MPTKTIEKLEQDLNEIIQAVEQAANYGMAHRQDPKITERTLADCEELLRHVMDASVLED
jgi:hypothetical protein